MRRRASVAGLLAGLLAAVLALTGCTSTEATGDQDFVGSAFQVEEVALDERGPVVDVSGTTIEGEPLDLARYRGQVLVVNVWWSGCGPCVKELPLLVDATGSFGDDVALVGINIRDSSAADAAAFERGLGVDFESLYDPSGQALLEFGDVNPRAIPSTVVLDREGRVAALVSGAIPTEQTLVSVLEPVVSGGADDGRDGAQDGAQDGGGQARG